MMFRRTAGCLMLLLAVAAAPVAAQTTTEEDREKDAAAEDRPFRREELRGVMEKVQQLGPWSEQAAWITEAQKALWERNGWNSESDQFARRLASAVESQPPWRIDQRLDTLCKMTAERYNLDEQQERQLRSQMIRESVGMLFRHGPTFVKNANLMLDRRLRGEPLDSETVAEIVKNAQPIVEQMIPDIERILDDFENNLEPEQREKFRVDRDALQKRRDRIVEQMDEWAAGKWSPEEWGMDRDPLVQRERGDPAASPEQLPENAPPVLSFESAWEAYVRQFVIRYDLDAAQQASAYAILQDLQQQAAKHRQRHEREIESLQASMRDGDVETIRRAGERLSELHAPVDVLFEQLKTRLSRIPTQAQKRAVEPPTADKTPTTENP